MFQGMKKSPSVVSDYFKVKAHLKPPAGVGCALKGGIQIPQYQTE